MTHSRRTRIVILLIIGSLTGLAPLAIDFYLPGLPQMTSDLGANASTGQLTLTACLLGIAVSQVVAGSISDTLGRRGPVLVGLVAFAVVSLLCAAAPGIWPLIGLRFAHGAAVGVGFVMARAIVRDIYDGREAARIFSLLVLISGLAPVLAPIAGGQVLLVTTWRGIFVVLAAFAVVLLAISVVWLPETLADHLRHEPGLRAKLRVYKTLLADRTFLPYASSGSLAFAAMFAYIAGSPFVLENVYDVSPQAYGLVFGANSVAIVAFSQISGRLVRRTGPSVLLTAGLTSMAAGSVGLLLAIVLDLGLAPVLGFMLVTIGSIGLIVPNATALALAEQPHAAGSASALFGLGQFGIGAIAAPLVGIAGSHDALPMGLVIAVCGIGALLVERLFAVRAARGAPRTPPEQFEAPVR